VYINKVNEIQGIDPYGVIAYVNRSQNRSENYINGQFTGLKWECVEYVRRWLITVKNVTFEKVETAEDLWKLRTATSMNGKTYDFVNVTNGIPPVGSLLIYKKTNKNPYGHVAVVVKVNTNREVEVAEQNYSLEKWKGYSRRINTREANLIGWKIVKTD